jgi:methyl-accepting chemotaxis protein
MANSNLETLLIVFIGIAALGVLLQGCVLLGVFLALRKAVQTGKEQADEFRGKLMPVLASSHELMVTAKDLFASTHTLIATVQPQLESAATELALMARDIHVQANQLQLAVDEVAEKARRQADRVDGMTTSVLNGLERFGSFVNGAVQVPMRQVNGVVAAAKAVMETLRTPAPPRPHRTTQSIVVADDKDLFV